MRRAGLHGEGRPARRRGLFGRLAAVFYVGSGLLGLVTLPLPAPGLDRAATALISVAALVAGIAIWFAPWRAWSRRASLWLVPPGFALIALANTFGGLGEAGQPPDELHPAGALRVMAVGASL